MKYYIYISKTKVEMLYPQIPPDFLEGASTEIKVNLGVVSMTLKGGKTSTEAELPEKLAAVTEFILARKEVGTIDAPKSYIRGTLPLKYSLLGNYGLDIAFFGGVFNGIKVGLIGSSSSLVGHVEKVETSHAADDYVLSFLKKMTESDDEQSPAYPRYLSFEEAIQFALDNVRASVHDLDFLARVLHKEGDLLVATPMYVAMVD